MATSFSFDATPAPRADASSRVALLLSLFTPPLHEINPDKLLLKDVDSFLKLSIP